MLKHLHLFWKPNAWKPNASLMLGDPAQCSGCMVYASSAMAAIKA